MTSGEVKLAVPTVWPDAPSTNPSLAGYVTTTCGGLSVVARSVVITGVTLAAAQNCAIIYGSTSGGGKGAVAPTATGPSAFSASVATTSSGTLTPLANPPVVTVAAANGSGTMTVSPTTLTAGSAGNTLTFTYTGATGGLSNGELKLAVPTGWPNAPSTTPSSAGYVTSTCGTVSVAGTTIMTSGVLLAGAQTCTIVYGSTDGGGPGAGAPTTTGTYTFTASEASTSPGTPKALTTSPAVTI
jgi:hypothetical protein